MLKEEADSSDWKAIQNQKLFRKDKFLIANRNQRLYRKDKFLKANLNQEKDEKLQQMYLIKLFLKKKDNWFQNIKSIKNYLIE